MPEDSIVIIGETTFYVSRCFGTRDLTESYADYVAQKIQADKRKQENGQA